MTAEDRKSAIIALGKRFKETRAQLSDFKLLSSPVYCQELLVTIESIRDELVNLNAAYRLEDDSIIIRSEYIVSFFEPEYKRDSQSFFGKLDLTNPEVVEKVALTCGIKQWLFLAEQIPDKAEKERFLSNCARIVADHGKRI